MLPEPQGLVRARPAPRNAAGTAADDAASSLASCSASDCFRFSIPCWNAASSSRSKRRPNRLRCRPAISSRSRSISASLASAKPGSTTPGRSRSQARRSAPPCAPPCHPSTRSRSDPTVGQSGRPQLRNCRRRFDGSFLTHVLHRPRRLHFDTGKPPRGVRHGFRLRRQKRMPPCRQLPAADAVLARRLCRRCAGRQALCRNRLLLLNCSATPPLVARIQLNPRITSALYDYSYERSPAGTSALIASSSISQTHHTSTPERHVGQAQRYLII